MRPTLITYFRSHKKVTFLSIFVVAFIVRLALLLHSLLQFPGNILGVGEEPKIAYALISKGQFADPYLIPTGPTAHNTPFFPLLLVGVYKLLGTGLAGQLGRCTLVFFGYSLLFALYPTLATAFGFPFEAGLVGGFYSALLPARRAVNSGVGWEESYAGIALAFTLLFVLRRYQSGDRSPRTAALLGLCWGISMYIGFAVFSILAGLLLVDVLVHRKLRVVADAAIVLLVTVAVMSPWLIRNHRVLHGWTLMRSNFGMELLLANHDNAHPSAEMIYVDPKSNLTFQHPERNLAEAMLLRQMGEIAYNRRCARLAVAWISTHPGLFARLTMERTAYFWMGPLNHFYETGVTAPYSVLGILGLALLRKHVGIYQFQIWCTTFFFYPLMYYIMVHTTRYRVPIDWMIWLSAGLLIAPALRHSVGTRTGHTHRGVGTFAAAMPSIAGSDKLSETKIT